MKLEANAPSCLLALLAMDLTLLMSCLAWVKGKTQGAGLHNDLDCMAVDTSMKGTINCDGCLPYTLRYTSSSNKRHHT